MAILSVVVVGVLHSATTHSRIAKNHGDSIQAYYLALAGIEKTKALLYLDAAERKRAARHHSGALYDSARDFREISLGRGQFSILRQGRRDEGGKLMYGVDDEESRLNINLASADDLGKLYSITPDIVAAIMDWRDGDNNVSPNGAEADYYASLPRPYQPRNGRFQTTRELLMVRGVTRQLFMGEDANQNGLLDPEEDDGDESLPPDNHDGVLDAGWSGDITVDSWVANLNAAGEERVNVQSADEKSLAAIPGLSREIAQAIVAYRGQKQLQNLADLLDVTAPRPQNQPFQGGNAGVTPGNPGQAQAQPTGPRVISEELLMEIGDDVTTLSGTEQPGAININTASVDVLSCLPGITPELAQAIVSYRKSAGYFPNVAHLLKVDGINRDIFRQVSPKVSVRSETFRILSEGRINSTGTRKRIQTIVRLSSDNIETIAWREDL